MNLEKFTDRAKGFLQSAQTIAIRHGHQRLTPTHLLKALIDDEEGMASGLIQRAGGRIELIVAELDLALKKIPVVSSSGSNLAPSLDSESIRILD